MTTDDLSIAPQDSEVSEISSGAAGDLSLQTVITRANALLSAGEGRLPERFDFRWQNIDFKVTPEQPDAAMTVLNIEACLGRLPYTAQDAAARNSALSMAEASSTNLPGRLIIDKDGLVSLRIETEPVTANGMAGFLKETVFRVLETADRLKQLQGLLVD